ncbi:hypothetical protein BGZ82_003712, partial [Podila clonocystis]
MAGGQESPSTSSSGNPLDDPNAPVTMAVLDAKLKNLQSEIVANLGDLVKQWIKAPEESPGVKPSSTTAESSSTHAESSSTPTSRQTKETPGATHKLEDALSRFCQPNPPMLSTGATIERIETAKKIKSYNGPARGRGQLVDDWVELFSEWFYAQVADPFIPELAPQVLRIFDMAIAKDQEVIEKVLQLRRREATTREPLSWSKIVDYLHFNMMPNGVIKYRRSLEFIKEHRQGPTERITSYNDRFRRAIIVFKAYSIKDFVHYASDVCDIYLRNLSPVYRQKVSDMFEYGGLNYTLLTNPEIRDMFPRVMDYMENQSYLVESLDIINDDEPPMKSVQASSSMAFPSNEDNQDKNPYGHHPSGDTSSINAVHGSPLQTPITAPAQTATPAPVDKMDILIEKMEQMALFQAAQMNRNNVRTPGPPASSQSAFKGKCHLCLESGHYAADCPRRAPHPGGPICYNCGEVGHISPKCSKPKGTRVLWAKCHQAFEDYSGYRLDMNDSRFNEEDYQEYMDELAKPDNCEEPYFHQG